MQYFAELRLESSNSKYGQCISVALRLQAKYKPKKKKILEF